MHAPETSAATNVPLPLEIRWHGRGGQGAVTAAKLLAEIALDRGAEVQSFPQFGSERQGAPIVAYTRISDRPIRLYNTIQCPNIVIVLDPSLLDLPPVVAGLTPDGLLLVDAEDPPAAVRSKLQRAGGVVATLPATAIALRNLGRPITATCLLGALLRFTPFLDLAAAVEHLRQKFAPLYPPEVVDGNVRALCEAYDAVTAG